MPWHLKVCPGIGEEGNRCRGWVLKDSKPTTVKQSYNGRKGYMSYKIVSMNIDISQYRATIGTFNLKYKNVKVQKEKSVRKVSYNYRIKMGNIYKFLYKKYKRKLSYNYKCFFNMGNTFKFLLPLFILFLFEMNTKDSNQSKTYSSPTFQIIFVGICSKN